MNRNEKITRQPRNPQKFDIIDLFDAIGRKEQFVLGDKKDAQKFVEIVGKSLSANITPTMIYGRRVEAMFSYIAASLGKCSLIKKEDSGDVFTSEQNLKVPDYRIVLNNDTHEQILVEVKSYFQKKPFAKYSINTNYLDSLINYSRLVKTSLYIAIYWTKWNVWTLVLPEDLILTTQKATISFSEALKRNRMGELGDIVIGTTPPLAIRIIPDKDKPRRVNEHDIAEFVIGRIDLYCNGTLITDETEQQIAFLLIQFGDWIENSNLIFSDESKHDIEYIEFLYYPEQHNEQQGFDIINSVSTIISRQYSQLTACNGQIKQLTPNIEPSKLGFVVPEDYRGKALPLWRFHVIPNLEE